MRIEAFVGLAMAIWCLETATRAGKSTWWVLIGAVVFGASENVAALVIEAASGQRLCYGGIRSPVTWLSMLFGVAVIAVIRRYFILGRVNETAPAARAESKRSKEDQGT
jgi:hypothetical protein